MDAVPWEVLKFPQAALNTGCCVLQAAVLLTFLWAQSQLKDTVEVSSKEKKK